MQHKIYNMDTSQTYLGIDMSDIMLGLLVWTVGNFLTGEFLPPRLQTLVTVCAIGLSMVIWRGTKDKLPPGFFRHFMAWATEANIYKLGPDTKSRPAVVDHKRVLAFLEEEKTNRSRITRKLPKDLTTGVADLRPNLQHTVSLVPSPEPAATPPLQTEKPTPRVTVAKTD